MRAWIGLALLTLLASGCETRVAQVAAGSFHSCALLNNGDVHCWGFGGNGQLGHEDTLTIGDDETPDSVGDVRIF